MDYFINLKPNPRCPSAVRSVSDTRQDPRTVRSGGPDVLQMLLAISPCA